MRCVYTTIKAYNIEFENLVTLIIILRILLTMSANEDETIDGTINETLVYSAEVQKAIDEVCV